MKTKPTFPHELSIKGVTTVWIPYTNSKMFLFNLLSFRITILAIIWLDGLQCQVDGTNDTEKNVTTTTETTTSEEETTTTSIEFRIENNNNTNGSSADKAKWAQDDDELFMALDKLARADTGNVTTIWLTKFCPKDTKEMLSKGKETYEKLCIEHCWWNGWQGGRCQDNVCVCNWAGLKLIPEASGQTSITIPPGSDKSKTVGSNTTGTGDTRRSDGDTSDNDINSEIENKSGADNGTSNNIAVGNTNVTTTNNTFPNGTFTNGTSTNDTGS